MAPQKKTSALAIAGLVLGILAALGCFLPIINNLSIVLALIDCRRLRMRYRLPSPGLGLRIFIVVTVTLLCWIPTILVYMRLS